MAEVVKFPEPSYVLTCRYCHERAFAIWLGSSDPDDYESYECLNEDCGAVFLFCELEVEVDNGET